MRKFIVRTLWALLVASILTAGLAFYAINEGWIGYMPPIEDLQNPINRFATQVISADGRVMGTWNYNRENRIIVDYTQLSPSLVQALVATEDVRFYEHSGIDFYALGRAIHYAAAGQAVVFRDCTQRDGTPVAETDRVGDSRQIGT